MSEDILIYFALLQYFMAFCGFIAQIVGTVVIAKWFWRLTKLIVNDYN